MTQQFTQEDAFELDGCGETAARKLVWRRFFRLMPGRIERLLKKREHRLAAPRALDD